MLLDLGLELVDTVGDRKGVELGGGKGLLEWNIVGGSGRDVRVDTGASSLEGVESFVDTCLDLGGADVGLCSDSLNLRGNIRDLIVIGLADLDEHIKLFA